MQSIKEIWDALVDRVRNPLLTGFVLSWCVLNYKAIVVLLADEHYSKKFDFIESALYPSSEASVMQLLVFPALFSAAYVFVLPAFSLLSTWAGSTYERLNANVRVKALKELTITAEQRDEVKRETALILEKAKKEAQEAIADRLDSSRSTRENVVNLFGALQTRLFDAMRVAPNWTGDVVKPVGRTVQGTPEQNSFLAKHGIPVKWAELFAVMRTDDSSRISAKEAAKRLDVGEQEALGILVGLCAVAMLDLDWVDDAPYFVMRESSWVALLNGRPA